MKILNKVALIVGTIVLPLVSNGIASVESEKEIGGAGSESSKAAKVGSLNWERITETIYPEIELSIDHLDRTGVYISGLERQLHMLKDQAERTNKWIAEDIDRIGNRVDHDNRESTGLKQPCASILKKDLEAGVRANQTKHDYLLKAIDEAKVDLAVSKKWHEKDTQNLETLKAILLARNIVNALGYTPECGILTALMEKGWTTLEAYILDVQKKETGYDEKSIGTERYEKKKRNAEATDELYFGRLRTTFILDPDA